MAVSDRSKSSPRFRAGLRALITLDLNLGGKTRGAAEKTSREGKTIRKTFPKSQNSLPAYRLKKNAFTSCLCSLLIIFPFRHCTNELIQTKFLVYFV